MKVLVLASGNSHKIKEFKEILNDFKVISMKELGVDFDIEENGSTFFENAKIKAMAIHNYLKSKGLDYYVVADDSGLQVEALNFEPGINSARYCGVHGNDEKNREKLLNNLKNEKNRKANFICSIVLICPNGEIYSSEGKTFGKILNKEEGYAGFGYDCLFYSDDLKKSFGVATNEEKNSVSHRGRALIELKEKIKNLI